MDDFINKEKAQEEMLKSFWKDFSWMRQQHPHAATELVSHADFEDIKYFLSSAFNRAYALGKEEGLAEEAVGCDEHCKQARTGLIAELVGKVREETKRNHRIWSNGRGYSDLDCFSQCWIHDMDAGNYGIVRSD